MKKCKLSPDEGRLCSCVYILKGYKICDVYDQLIEDLKKCPLEILDRFTEKKNAVRSS